MHKTKKIPYGITDFAEIREDNYYYINKTRFISLLREFAFKTGLKDQLNSAQWQRLG